MQPGALVIHSNAGEAQTMQMVASPKTGTSQAQTTSSMTPQAAQEARDLANASETLKAQAQTLKVCWPLPCRSFPNFPSKGFDMLCLHTLSV